MPRYDGPVVSNQLPRGTVKCKIRIFARPARERIPTPSTGELLERSDVLSHLRWEMDEGVAAIAAAGRADRKAEGTLADLSENGR